LAIVQPSLSGPEKGPGLAIRLRPIFDLEGSGDYPASVGWVHEMEEKGKEERGLETKKGVWKYEAS